MTCASLAFNGDPANTDLHHLESAITELSAHLSAATYRLLCLVREFDAREGWRSSGMRSCAHWLNWKCGFALGAAREKVRVAHSLARLPLISASFGEGRLSYSKVRAMTRVATRENEDYLLMIARHGTATHVERLVRSYRSLGKQAALERAIAQHASQAVSWHIDDDGCYVVRARLCPEDGARITQAIEHAADVLYREQHAQAPQAGDGAPENVPAGTSGGQERPARRAEALARIADNFLAVGDRCTLHIHTDVDTLRATGQGAEAELEEGGPIAAETARRLACDCGVVHWLENTEGNALDIGRRSRSIPPAIRRVLKRRDGGCRFPGCTARHHVDAHHIRHWADGGETTLNNLVLLCRHHHRLVHEGGYGVTLSDAGEATFTTQDGVAIPRGPDIRSRGNAITLGRSHEERGLTIDAKTVLPRWFGEHMDLGMATDGLLRRDHGSETCTDPGEDPAKTGPPVTS